MNMRDLIPWGRTAQTPTHYREEDDPFMTLHREMNRLFDDVFRGFEAAPFGGLGRMASWPGVSWPNVEESETDKEVRISAELPGLEEKDVEVLLGDSVLTIRGEKRLEVAWRIRAAPSVSAFTAGSSAAFRVFSRSLCRNLRRLRRRRGGLPSTLQVRRPSLIVRV